MSGGGLVWSSESGRMCPKCRRSRGDCVCRQRDQATPRADSNAVVKVGRQTKGRRGKGVTVVTGVPLPGAELAQLAKELKRRCGSGGTVKDGAIEIQGDHRDALVTELERRGFRVKRVGG